MEKIYRQTWIELSQQVRDHLIKVFGLHRTGIAEVRDSTLISDGMTDSDLSFITKEKMAEYVGSMEEFSKLWALTVSKAKFELNPPLLLGNQGIELKQVSNEDFSKLQKVTEEIENSTSVISATQVTTAKQNEELESFKKLTNPKNEQQINSGKESSKVQAEVKTGTLVSDGSKSEDLPS